MRITKTIGHYRQEHQKARQVAAVRIALTKTLDTLRISPLKAVSNKRSLS